MENDDLGEMIDDVQSMISNIEAVKGAAYAKLITSLFSLHNLGISTNTGSILAVIMKDLIGGLHGLGWLPLDRLDEIMQDVSMLHRKQTEHHRKHNGSS